MCLKSLKYFIFLCGPKTCPKYKPMLLLSFPNTDKVSMWEQQKNNIYIRLSKSNNSPFDCEVSSCQPLAAADTMHRTLCRLQSPLAPFSRLVIMMLTFIIVVLVQQMTWRKHGKLCRKTFAFHSCSCI